VIGFEITRSKGASEVDVEKGVAQALEKLKASHPDIKITEAFNFVKPVADNYKGSMSLLYEGAILAILVVWLFLRDWRATIIAATALPQPHIPVPKEYVLPPDIAREVPRRKCGLLFAGRWLCFP
jgi:multidrug efflux pump subunit AcrB